MEVKVLSIGQICKRFSSGKNITSQNISEKGVYPVYGGNGLRGYTDTYNFEGECAIVGRQGAYCGNVKYVRGKAYMSEHAIVAVTNSEHNNKYFYYKLSLAKLGRFSGQAAQPGLSVTKLLRLKLEMPSRKYQDVIASILSTYDTLIENNTKRIRLLEKMAENLYKEWFVRFRFPGHENVEMENGLPKGWKVMHIKDIATLKSGFAFKSEWFVSEGCGVAKIKDIGETFMDLSNLSYVCEDNCKKAQRFILKEGMLTIALTGATIGKISIVPKHSTCIYTNQRLGKFFVENQPIDSLPFLYCLFSQESMVQDIINLANSSSAQPNISPEQINDIKFTCDEKIIDKYNQMLKGYFQIMIDLHCQNSLLARQRDLLLPRLMSGKLEVKVKA